MYCVEPEGKDLQHSLDSCKRLWDSNSEPIDTIADGIRVLRVGEKCFTPIYEKCEKKVLTVVSFIIKRQRKREREGEKNNISIYLFYQIIF